MLRYLCSIVACFFGVALNAQMAIHGDLYLGPDYELYDAFDLTSFESGIISIERNGGLFSFSANAEWENSDNTKHLDGYIRKYGTTAFTFPTGHGGQYQPLHVSQANTNAAIDVAFVATPHNTSTRSSDLEAIYPNFYWSIKNATDQGRITLSWNTNTNLAAFIGSKPLSSLVIAGLQGGQWQLIASQVDTNSLIDFSTSSEFSGSITSDQTINLSSFTAFTLGLNKSDFIATENMSVSEGVTPNNDGINDEWIVEGIEAHPQAQVYVYNRLGKLVFSALSGYDNSWTGHYKGSLEPLPVGPYFYTIDLEPDGKIDLQGWIYINY